MALADATAKDSAALRVSLTGGYSEDETVTTTHSETAISSALLAGNNLTLTARGREGDAVIAGDILSRGSVLSAGNAVSLEAANDIQLLSAANLLTSDREHLAFSAGGGIAASYGGGGGASLGGTAYGSVGYGTGDELMLEHQETTIDAKSFTFASGRDTTLKGAVVKADSIEGSVGRHLTLASEQDRVTFGSEDMSLGGSATFGYGADYSVSASAGEITSDYLSVIEQTGLFAGKGGFTIQVGGHTDLTGAVIASTASADQNSLDTQTLAYRDLENHAEWSMDQATAGTGLVFGLADGDSDHNSTRAAIAAGTLTVRDDAPSGKDSVANLLRDTTQAHQVLGQNFDETEVRESAELVQEVAGLVVPKVFDLIGDISQRLDLEEGSPEKIALHALGGAAVAALGGGNPLAGMGTAAANEWMMGQLNTYFEAHPELSATEQKVIAQGASTLLGSLLNGAQGATIAVTATQNNYLKHAEVIAMGEKLARCNFNEKCTAKVKAEYKETSAQHQKEVLACGADTACQFMHEAEIQAGMLALATDGNLGYGGYSLRSSFIDGQEGDLALNKTPTELKPLAMVAGFMIANCERQWTAACQQKLATQKDRQLRQAAILIGVVAAPAVVAGVTVSAQAITACTLNPLCRLEAIDQLGGAAAGMPTGITGVSASVAAATTGVKLAGLLDNGTTLKSADEVGLFLEKLLQEGISPKTKPLAFSGGKPTLSNDPFGPDVVNQRSAEYYSMYGDNPLRGTLSSEDARKWYLGQEGNIPNLLDTTQPLSGQARQAFDLRNQFRSEARELMRDRITADRLFREEINLTWDNLLVKTENKLINNGVTNPTSNQIYQEVINSSQRSRQSVNKALSL